MTKAVSIPLRFDLNHNGRSDYGDLPFPSRYGSI